MKHLSQEAIDYIRATWGFDTSGSVDDMSMFMDCGYPELTALRLVNGGAVEKNCKEAEEMHEIAASISLKEEQKIIKECLQDYTVLVCGSCNYHHFIPSWCQPKDWVNGTCDGCGKHGHVKKSRGEKFMKKKKSFKGVEMSISFRIIGQVNQDLRIIKPDVSPQKLHDGLNSGKYQTVMHVGKKGKWYVTQKVKGKRILIAEITYNDIGEIERSENYSDFDAEYEEEV